MRLSSAIGIATLTIALTSGCAWYNALFAKPKQTPPKAASAQSTMTAPTTPTPAPTAPAPAVVSDAKLDAIDHRLERIEQLLGEVRDQGQKRQQQEARTQQALAGLHKGAQQQQGAMERINKQLATQHAALMTRLKEVTEQQKVDFWAVDIPLGALPNAGQGYQTRRIPAQIPDKAKEILVYVQVATGYVKAGPHRFRIAVRVLGAREAAFYLYAMGSPQPSWAYNSDNVWLPLPKDRQLILSAEGEPFFGDWSSEVRIIAWR